MHGHSLNLADLSAGSCANVQVLERCRGVPQVDTEFEDIVEAARQSNLIKSPYLNIMQRKYRPQLIIACIFMIFQQFDGINAIIFYAPVLFEGIAGGSKGALLNTVVVNLGALFNCKAALYRDQASLSGWKQAQLALYGVC